MGSRKHKKSSKKSKLHYRKNHGSTSDDGLSSISESSIVENRLIAKRKVDSSDSSDNKESMIKKLQSRIEKLEKIILKKENKISKSKSSETSLSSLDSESSVKKPKESLDYKMPTVPSFNNPEMNMPHGMPMQQMMPEPMPMPMPMENPQMMPMQQMPKMDPRAAAYMQKMGINPMVGGKRYIMKKKR